jgi:RNA polymerase sigma-70 factor (ECF subfamily)
MRRVVCADDILQDIWITVVRNASEVTACGWSEFDPWLTRIAQRRIADAIRRAGSFKRGGRANLTYERRQTTSFVDLFARVQSPQVSPSREISAREATHAVQIAMTALPDHYRTALTLRYLHGKSHADIARALRMSRPAVNSLLYRGLRKLKELLGSASRFFSDDGTPTTLAEALR